MVARFGGVLGDVNGDEAFNSMDVLQLRIYVSLDDAGWTNQQALLTPFQLSQMDPLLRGFQRRRAELEAVNPFPTTLEGNTDNGLSGRDVTDQPDVTDVNVLRKILVQKVVPTLPLGPRWDMVGCVPWNAQCWVHAFVCAFVFVFASK